jgi:hypothetical protein
MDRNKNTKETKELGYLMKITIKEYIENTCVATSRFCILNTNIRIFINSLYAK